MAFSLFSPASAANLVILPQEFRGLDTAGWTNVLLGCEPASSSPPPPHRGKARKRAKELLAGPHASAESAADRMQTELEAAATRLEDPAVDLLGADDLNEVLEFFDSAYADWHTARGLPKQFGSQMDVLAITQRNRAASQHDYFQEFSLLGLKESGYHTDSDRI